MVTLVIGKYMSATPVETKTKTSVYSINNVTHGDVLGVVKWNGAWRQYCFFTTGEIILSSGCMKDLQEFLDEINKRRKSGE